MSDDPIERLEAEVASDGWFADESEAYHSWLAAHEAAKMLDLEEVVELLKPEHPLLDMETALEQFPNGEDHDAMSAFIDKLGDSAKVLLQALATTLDSRGMGHARANVVLICHRGLATVVFNGTEMPRIYEWK